MINIELQMNASLLIKLVSESYSTALNTKYLADYTIYA